MKKLIIFILLILSLSVSFAEAPSLSVQEVSEGAIPLYEILFSCPSAMSFETEPEADFAFEAVWVYAGHLILENPQAQALSNEEAYFHIFRNGSYPVFEEGFMPLPVKAFPANVQIESAIESGTGTIIVSLRVENDYGYGMEFSCYVDVHIYPDPNAPFGATVDRIFFPE